MDCLHLILHKPPTLFILMKSLQLSATSKGTSGMSFQLNTWNDQMIID